MSHDFGGAFRPMDAPVIVAPPPVPFDIDALVEALAAQLVMAMAYAPAPQVHIEAPEGVDYVELVNAVVGLKGPSSADEIGKAVARYLAPARTAAGTNESGVVAAIRDLVEKVDFRLKGFTPAGMGGGSVRLEPGQVVTAVGGATEATLAEVAADIDRLSAGIQRQKTHVEFIPSSAAPTTIYKGYAAPGTADAIAAWTIQRFIFTGVTAIDETWSALSAAVWANRATETYS